MAQLIRDGRKALAEYDFEAARAHLTEAFDGSGGGVEEGRALLELLVDHLAAFDEALALEPDLSRAARSDPEIRCRLAVAAAQRGDEARALALLEGLADRHAAEALMILARKALDQERFTEASTLLARARRLNASHPELLLLAKDLELLRAVDRLPAEEELERIAADNDDAATKAQAERVLNRWPDSALARRLLHEVQARMRQKEAAALLAEGIRALERQDWAAAARLFRQAEALGAAGAAEKAANAELQERRRREQLQVEQVVAELQKAPEAALLSYLSLEAALRGEVRRRTALPELAWLESLQPHVGPHQAKPAVAAASALARAEDRLAKDPEAALALLAPHERWVQKVRRARELHATASAAIHEQQRRTAEERLDEAREAIRQGNVEHGQRLLAAVPTGLLSPGTREEAEALARRLSSEEEARRRSSHVDELLAAGACFEALEWVNAALDQASTAERGAWEDHRTNAVQAATRAMKVRQLTWEGAAPSSLMNVLEDGSRQEVALPVLSLAGDRLYLVTAYSDWIFVYVLDVERQGVCKLVSLRPPEQMQHLHAHVTAEALWIIGSKGAVLQLSLEDWRVLRWRGAQGLVAPGEVVERSLLVPGSRFLWMDVRRDRLESLRIFDLARGGRLHRELGSVKHLSLVLTTPEPCVLASDFDEGARVHAAHGVQLVSLPQGMDVERLEIHPARKGYLALVRIEDNPVQLTEVTPEGRKGGARSVAEALTEAPHVLAVSLQSRCAYLAFIGGEKSWLHGYRFEAAPEELFRVESHGMSFLAQDLQSRQVLYVAKAGEGVQCVPLGAGAPQVQLEPEPRFEGLPAIDRYFICGPALQDNKASDIARSIREQPNEEARARRAERVRESSAPDAASLISTSQWLRVMDQERQADAFLAFARVHHPEHPLVDLEDATVCVFRGQWAEALAFLERLSPPKLEDHLIEHFHHMRGVALFELGRLEEARAAFCAEPERAALCNRKAWLDIVDWHRGVVAGRSEECLVWQILDAIKAGDAAIARGDWAGARQVLDCWPVWRLTEVQSMARLALAFLAEDGGDEPFQFRKALALAGFLDRAEHQAKWPWSSLPVLERGWSRARIGEVAAQARAWLERR